MQQFVDVAVCRCSGLWLLQPRITELSTEPLPADSSHPKSVESFGDTPRFDPATFLLFAYSLAWMNDKKRRDEIQGLSHPSKLKQTGVKPHELKHT